MLQGDLKAQGEEMGQLLRHEVKTVYLLPSDTLVLPSMGKCWS